MAAADQTWLTSTMPLTDSQPLLTAAVRAGASKSPSVDSPGLAQPAPADRPDVLHALAAPAAARDG